MPRIGFSIEEQTSSSQFKFEGGRGRVVNAVAVVQEKEGYDAKCGIRFTVQRIGKDGKPSGDDVVEEFLACGPISKFHPANASSPDDENPEDLGDDVGTEGNCILAIEGAHVDKKAKLSIFGTSLQDKGVRPTLLNGYAPHLIDIEADFEQLTLPKGDNYTGKRDPTCLIVARNGEIYNLAAINKRAGGSTSASTKPAAAASTTKPAAASKANGAPKPPASAPSPATSPATGGDVAEEAESKTMELLMGLPGKTEQKLTRQKLGSKFVTLLVNGKVPPKLHKPSQAFVANAEWLNEKAEMFGWTVSGDEITIPAAE